MFFRIGYDVIDGPGLSDIRPDSSLAKAWPVHSSGKWPKRGEQLKRFQFSAFESGDLPDSGFKGKLLGITFRAFQWVDKSAKIHQCFCYDRPSQPNESKIQPSCSFRSSS